MSKVKIWYDQRTYENILLGHKLKISTTHLWSLMKTVALAGAAASEVPANIMTSIFPEKDTSCSLEVLSSFQYNVASAPVRSSIIGLDHILEAGHEGKLDPIIVVIVLSIGQVTTSIF